ncbi:MAG: N-acetylmuramic acid 6-phosphate etherase [Saprospiraceae bacterium]
MLEYKQITESDSAYHDLEQKSAMELLIGINSEDQKVALAVKDCIPDIEKLVLEIVSKLNEGGRLFYIGAGTSGRLGILDASECPPTYGVSPDLVIGLIAGGDSAIRTAVEGAEDSKTQAWMDLENYSIDSKDIVIGIAASGKTPYVVNGLRQCQENGIRTACITCNPNSPINLFSDHRIVPVVGSEFVTGSTRMKSGTAQKMILNMISTSTMILLGRVLDNKMVDMKLNNTKLWERGISQITDRFKISNDEAIVLLHKYQSVRTVINFLKESTNP